ncbi:MAG: glycosyltransferase, partial [bacterium]
MPVLFKDTIDYLIGLDLAAITRVFWLFLILDLPRYILTDVYILLRAFFAKKQSTSDDGFFLTENPPRVSVIIPVLNEQDTIAWTIRSLQEQSYKNLQLIIVDDGSTDGTPAICQRLARDEKLTFLRFSSRAGKSAALNYGLKFASGEFVVFVDSDTTFDRDAIYELIKKFADPKVGGVSGNLRVRNGDTNLLTSLQQIEYLFTISIGRRIRSSFGILPIISGAFGGFRRKLISLETMGGHEPGPGNDSDLAIRVRKTGYKIVFQPSAVCLTNVPDNLISLVKQRTRWDRNLIKNRLRKHNDIFNPFSKNFRFVDLVTYLDSIFFNLVVSAIIVFYVADLALNFSTLLPALLLINFCLYFLAEFIELAIAITLDNRVHDLKLIPYLFLFHPYKLLLKFIRIGAY